VFIGVLARLSLCPLARVSQKLHLQTSRNFLSTSSAAVASSSADDNAIRYALPVLRTTPSYGNYQFLLMPFGIQYASATASCFRLTMEWTPLDTYTQAKSASSLSAGSTDPTALLDDDVCCADVWHLTRRRRRRRRLMVYYTAVDLSIEHSTRHTSPRQDDWRGDRCASDATSANCDITMM